MINNPLFKSLDGAGIDYSVRQTSRGIPYASLLWSTDTLGATDISALIEENVLRFIVHQINIPADHGTVSAKADSLPLAAVYISPDHGGVEMSVGFYQGESDFNIEQLVTMLNYLDSCRRCLENNGNRVSNPQLKKKPNKGGKDIIDILSRYGHRPHPIECGGVVEVKITQKQSLRIEIIEEESSWIRAAGRYLPPNFINTDSDDMKLFYRLQRWATAGRFQISPDAELSAASYTPLLDSPRDKVITWTTSQVAAMLQTAARHYRF